MSVPTKTQLKSGAKIVQPQSITAGQTVACYAGDVIPHSTDGWHVCISTVPVTIGPGGHGLVLGQSNDQWKYSRGASYSGQGVPASPGTAPTTYDGTATGYGSDGRASLDGVTFGGATGAAGSGGGSGSPSRGF
jgi:hypothetical protein